MSTSTIAEPVSTSRTVWRLAWPNIVSNLLFTTVGFVQIKIASALGTSSVAAITTGNRIFFLVQAILMGVSVAATAMIARSWGARQVEQAELVSWNAIVIAVLVAAALSVPILLAPAAIAGLFGLDSETTAIAATFIFWLGLFNVINAINMLLSTALRATGDVITPLWFLLFSSVVNAAFSYLFAFGVGPLPHMGVAGIALGGSFGAMLITIAFVASWWRGIYNLKPARRKSLDPAITRQLVSIGAPAVLEQGIVQLAFLAFFAIVAHYGTTAYAAYGIGITLVAFPIVVGFGFGIATATLVGQHLGARQADLAVLAVSRSLRMSLAAMIALSVLLAWIAEDLARFMIKDPDAVHLTVAFMYIIALAQPFMAFEFTLGGALRGAGDTRFPLIATFCGIIFGRLIPASIFASMGFSVYWIFAVMLIDYTIKAIMLMHRFRSRKWLNIPIDLPA